MAFAALTLVGCAQDDVVHESPSVNNAIRFGTYIGRPAQTRASVETFETIKEKGFGIFAFYTGKHTFAQYTSLTPNFMYNQQVTWDEAGSQWTYSPVKYWPNNEGDMLSFIAYAPYDADQTWPLSDYASKQKIRFTVADAVQDQKDLLWNKTPQIDLTKPDVEKKIEFNFGHALARIGFKLAGAFDQVDPNTGIDDNTVITVKKVMLCGEPHTYNGPSTDGNQGGSGYTPAVVEPTTGFFYTKGMLDLTATGSAPTWTFETDGNAPGYQILTWSSETPGDFAPEANILKKDADGERVLNGDAAYAMVIPQATTGDHELYVYIEYEVTTTDANDAEGKVNSSTITNYISKKVTIPEDQLVAGKAYTLKLVLGMTTVKVSTEFTEWDPVQPDVQVDLPQNTPVA